MSFEPEELELLATTGEVHVETRKGDRVYRTVIWVAVDGEDVFIRSVQGESGRWYQRAIANPEIALDAQGRRIPARAIPATESESVERASEAFRRKYPQSGSLEAMVRTEVLGTTLRLEAS